MPVNIVDIATHFRGDPHRKMGSKFYWGKKGSLVVDTDKNIFSDFEAGIHGGLLDYICFEVGLLRHDTAYNWCCVNFGAPDFGSINQGINIEPVKARTSLNPINEEALGRVNIILGECVEPPSDFDYLLKKGLKSSYGAMYWPRYDVLVIPVYREGKACSIQTINRAGDKKFLAGGTVKGASFSIGGDTGKQVVCEGFATGASYYIESNLKTYCALSSGNILSVIDGLVKDTDPENIIAALDNDWENPKGNAGEKVAATIRDKYPMIKVVMPPCIEGVSDFNDMHNNNMGFEL